MTTLTGYNLLKTLEKNDHVMLLGAEYLVISVQHDYDYTVSPTLAFTCYAEIKRIDGGKHIPYAYLKNLPNDPTWSLINKLMPVVSSEPYARDTEITINDALDLLVEKTRLESALQYASDTLFMMELNKRYISPMMRYTAIYALLCAAIGYRPIPTITIKHSKRLPITTTQPYHGQQRVVSYKVVRLAKVSIGDSVGLRYGFITLDKTQRVVKSHMQSSGLFGQWELI